MKSLKVLLFFTVLLTLAFSTYSKSVYVKGYTRKDGTYVAPHYRSSPDHTKSNNYGPSRTSSERLSPTTRDSDGDGTPNYLDNDDNNNGISDDNEKYQYRTYKKSY